MQTRPRRSYLAFFFCRHPDEWIWEVVVLQAQGPPQHQPNHNANARSNFKLSVCVADKWLPYAAHPLETATRLFRGSVVGGPLHGEEVVAKAAFPLDPEGMERLTHEADNYSRLGPLQGKVVPKCLHYVATDSDGRLQPELPCAVLVTIYYGETLYCQLADGSRPDSNCWEGLDGIFKQRIIAYVCEIHNLGLELGHFGPDHVILDEHSDRAMIVGLADAEAHVCKRPARALVHGAIAPLPKEFKCEEIHDLCSDMQMWLPPYIQCYGDLYKTEVFFPRHWLLAAKASPEHYTRQEAIKTAIDVIVEVARTYTIDDGDDLCDRIAKRRREIETDFIEGKEPDEAEYGIARITWLSSPTNLR